MECLIDNHHGIYIPQYFYENFNFKEFGLKKEDYKDLSDPNNEFYWEAWEELLDKARFTNKEGKFILYQDEGDVFLANINEMDYL